MFSCNNWSLNNRCKRMYKQDNSETIVKEKKGSDE